jgi:uncharacterized damage-inducible protein DinB
VNHARGPKGARVPVALMLMRLLVINHLVHHRAQLGIYLRLLNVPTLGRRAWAVAIQANGFSSALGP